MFKQYSSKRYSKDLVEAKSLKDGCQSIYRFTNGYGASVVCHSGSYGGSSGLFELAVIQFNGISDNDWMITYKTPVTRDVMGYLSSKEVSSVLSLIKSLGSDGDFQ